MGEADCRTLVAQWFPELTDSGPRQVSWPRIEPKRGCQTLLRVMVPHGC